MTNSSFLKKLIFALTAFSVVLFVACDDDFNSLGSDVIDGDIHSDMIREEVSVAAYDRPTGAVQANNMTQNQLGVYDNPVFGKTVSNFVTQVVMASENPTLYEPIVDSAYLYIPYQTNAIKTNSDGETIYAWGKTSNYNTYIFGDTLAKFNLKIYQNGYYLRDSDPGATDNVQRYYSDDKSMVESLVVGQPLFDADTLFSTKEVRIDAKVTDDDGNVTDKVVERKKPGLYIQFDPARINELFFSQANRSNLLNNTIFKNYFRGLYFKVEQLDKAVMNMPDFASGTITVKMRDYESLTSGSTAGPDLEKGRIRKTVTFNLKGNTINFFDNSYNTEFTSGVASSNVTEGDETIYLKGGAGSMAVLDINVEKLQNLKTALGQNVLINEANLVFCQDNGKMGVNNAVRPLRLYVYDLKTRKPIIDYSMDATTNLANSKGDKYIYGGILDTLGKYADGSYKIGYKVRLTNHVKNLIKGDSLADGATHHRLGLVLTDNINIITNYKLKTPFTEGSGESANEVKEIPYSSVQGILGTVIHGSGPAVPDEKRIKLEIYYSKPKE